MVSSADNKKAMQVIFNRLSTGDATQKWIADSELILAPEGSFVPLNQIVNHFLTWVMDEYEIGVAKSMKKECRSATNTQS